MNRKPWRIAGINFTHFHMGDLLRFAHDHPRAEIVGLADDQPQRMEAARRALGIPQSCLFSDYRKCLEATKPDIVILCPATAHHADWVKKVAPFGVHLIVEKPFAASLPQADSMIAAMPPGKTLMINWPAQWSAGNQMLFKFISHGHIGDVTNVWYFGGNRGPLWHGADKKKKTAQTVTQEKPNSWFYQKSAGGGSLLDYLGYGATLGTWYQSGRRPLDVTAVVDEPAGLEVDEHSIVIARYAHGLSKFETRWGTFTDPWTTQPQPKCGFIIAGTGGTLSSYGHENFITAQTKKNPRPHQIPVGKLTAPNQNPVQYLIHSLENGQSLAGPVSLSISRIGQEIIDAARRSARLKRTISLVN